MGRSELRVVYLEDREEEYQRFAPILRDALSIRGLYCEVAWAKDRNGFERELQKRPHVAFCDLDLGGGAHRFEGLQIIADLKRRYPDVLFLLLTGQNFSVGKIGSYIPNPDHIIDKEYLGTDEYNNYLAEYLRSNLKRYPVTDISCDFDLKVHGPKHGAKAKLGAAELDSMIEQCLYGVDTDIDGAEISRVKLEVIPEGLSGSGVYRMHIWTGDRANKVPGILKVSEISRAREELANYNKYVKWRLPYMWRVDVMGFGMCEKFGAICYSVAMGGENEPSTVNRFLREGTSSVIDTVVKTILDSRSQNWYAERVESGKDARIYFSGKPYYRSNKKREEREGYFKQKLEEIAISGSLRPVFGEHVIHLCGRQYPNINRTIFGRDWGSVMTCVCHGDMNGSNVMCTPDGKSIAFIDFQSTGFHYLFKDFISFEASVRLELPDVDIHWEDRHLCDIIDREIQLNEAQWSLVEGEQTYNVQISKIRQAAHKNFDAGFTLYMLANTVHSLWLLEKSSKWAPYKQRRLIASVVAGATYLASQPMLPNRNT